MASNLRTVMLWEDACRYFTEEMLPRIIEEHESDGTGKDLPARREAWNNWVDALCKSEVISVWQCENWSHPACND